MGRFVARVPNHRAGDRMAGFVAASPGGMGNILISLIHTLSSGFRTRASLPAEIPALRHQLAILKQSA